jgi:hypothetical protein
LLERALSRDSDLHVMTTYPTISASPASAVRAAAAVAVLPLRAAALLPVLPVAALLLHQNRPVELTPAWCSDDTLWQPSTSGIELSVVMPFYNPGDAMRPNVERAVEGLRARGIGFEVVCVSDGSTDGSEHTLSGIGPEVRVLVNPVNRGKGAALHTGFAHARGRYIGMVDADGDIDPMHLADYFDVAEASGVDVVYADKRLGSSTSKSSSLRKLVSLGFSTMVGTLFALGVRDTQTGCKLFSRRAMQRVLPRLHEERFAFDLEFFVAAKAAGIQRMVAAPVHLAERLAGSTVTAKTIVRTLVDALTVFGRLHLTRAYRHDGAVAPVAVSDARPTVVATWNAVPTQRVPQAARVPAALAA